MTMFSEIATEGTIRAFVEEIERELRKNAGNPEACKVLKKIGGFALTQFEWSTPDWAMRYRELFEVSSAREE